MSFSLALVLPDGVFILADGRQVKPLFQDAIVSDDLDKIQIIHGTFALVPFGITVATDAAIQVIHERWPVPARREDVCQLVKNAAEYGWTTTVCRLAADVDRTDPSLCCALIGGGVLDGKPLVTSILVGFTSHDSRTMDQAGEMLLLGGEDFNVSGLIEQDIRQAFNKCRYNLRRGPCNATITEIVRLVAARVVWLGSQDRSIGGKIRYAIFRDRYPAYKDYAFQ